ncbi:MAG: biotin--[acetyl-CoA-carboxylase] ligase [Planctomycetia bacterium]|nr:biotin--[acetyl-CoA-carboxylase] ligase [Planctomycetia bacterium]MCC7314026.1 biotin--[acetyl-CoA-carboxylase] ligase [Planctomycetota bacterium]OQY99287.1 MAG: biotin--[acetyl-CoA-carboxylase] ligase [Planctomycetes bacterium UTPLA1]
MRPDSDPHVLSADEIRRGLNTVRIGRHITVLAETDSTNTFALDFADSQGAGQCDGAVILAEYQTAGRGRLGRKWLSPRGAGLHMTVLLTMPRTKFLHGRLMMATAIAVLEGILDSTDVEPTIRWPNDLYVGERKLCGILVETRSQANDTLVVAVGIGVNCLQHESHFPPELRGRATSLEMESRQPIDRAAVVRSILIRLDSLLARPESVDDSHLARRWLEWTSDLNARVTLLQDGRRFTGRIVEIHPVSGLILQEDNGVCRHFEPATTSRE